MNKCDKSECGCSAVPSPEGLCGCGNPVRYMTPSGGTCNKYSRCLPYAEQGEAREAKNTQCAALTELLKEASNAHKERSHLLPEVHGLWPHSSIPAHQGR